MSVIVHSAQTDQTVSNQLQNNKNTYDIRLHCTALKGNSELSATLHSRDFVPNDAVHN